MKPENSIHHEFLNLIYLKRKIFIDKLKNSFLSFFLIQCKKFKHELIGLENFNFSEMNTEENTKASKVKNLKPLSKDINSQNLKLNFYNKDQLNKITQQINKDKELTKLYDQVSVKALIENNRRRCSLLDQVISKNEKMKINELYSKYINTTTEGNKQFISYPKKNPGSSLKVAKESLLKRKSQLSTKFMINKISIKPKIKLSSKLSSKNNSNKGSRNQSKHGSSENIYKVKEIQDFRKKAKTRTSAFLKLKSMMSPLKETKDKLQEVEKKSKLMTKNRIEIVEKRLSDLNENYLEEFRSIIEEPDNLNSKKSLENNILIKEAESKIEPVKDDSSNFSSESDSAKSNSLDDEEEEENKLETINNFNDVQLMTLSTPEETKNIANTIDVFSRTPQTLSCPKIKFSKMSKITSEAKLNKKNTIDAFKPKEVRAINFNPSISDFYAMTHYNTTKQSEMYNNTKRSFSNKSSFVDRLIKYKQSNKRIIFNYNKTNENTMNKQVLVRFKLGLIKKNYRKAIDN